MVEDRYAVLESEDYEPGSNQQVLKNLLGIKDKLVIEEVEASELERTGSDLVNAYDAKYQFCVEDLCDIHALWLAQIYHFAGHYRSVNMSKGGFLFAAVQQIPRLMVEFENKYLQLYTPCNFKVRDELAYALGVVHVEFILIHPFREGNGRVARLLANIMALQAGRNYIDYTPIDRTKSEKGYNQYISAIHAGYSGDYTAIKNVFLTLLEEN